jgi:predicted alpha/beta hydrolase family esterase
MFEDNSLQVNLGHSANGGHSSARIHVVPHRPHDTANVALLYIPGYKAPHQTDPKATAIREAATQLGAAAYFFNYAGHDPDEEQTNLCLATYRNNAVDAFDHVRDAFKHQHVILCAHSMGVVFALQIAAQHHRNVIGCFLVSPVIGLMDPPLKDDQDCVIVEAGLGHKRIIQVRSILEKLEAGEHVSPRGIDAFKYHPKFLSDYAEWGSLSTMPQNIVCPTVIVTAERDPFVHSTHAQAIQRNIPGCEHLHFVSGATHEMKQEVALAALTASLVEHMPRMRRHAQGLHP